jgi:hypothetical protein
MNPSRKRTLLRLGIVLIAGLAMLVWVVSNRSHSVVIENRSGQKIDRLEVTISGETSQFQGVPNGGQASGTFKSGGDAHFTVDGRLADDTRFHTSGKAGENLHFLVLPGGEVRLRPEKNAPQ